MKINFECVVFYSNNFFTEVELPDDIKFYEYCRHNDKQRFYVTIYKNNDELFKHLNKEMCGRVHHYVFGDYMILNIRQCHPVNENLQLMSLGDLNTLFNEHIKGYYIKSERPSRKQQKDPIIIKTPEPVENGLINITDYYPTINKEYYTEYIAKPLGFVDRTGEDLCMKFATIQKYSWLDNDFHNHVHRFEIDIKELKLFDEDYSHGQKITISNSEEITYEYDKEIENLLEMDNYNYEDYRIYK